MQDTTHTNTGADQVVIAGVDGQFWLLQGEAHLSALFTRSGGYPTPVLCAHFDSVMDLSDLLASEKVELDDLWSINADIINRLSRDNEVVDVVRSQDT